jgi:hypothetical protein
MSIKIVISRYNEDLDWTNNLENVIIYNKGNDDIDLDKIKHPIIKLLNVGREGHTYYQYIYDNYNNLDDYTIFLQGNPFDHSPNLFTTIKDIELLIQQEKINFKNISEWIVTMSLDGCPCHQGLPLKDVYKKVFINKEEITHSFQFGAGAQFIVSKESIQKHPKEFYLNIINLLNYNINPIEGFVIERFHPLIFS